MTPLLLCSDLPVTRARAAKSRHLRDDPLTPSVSESVARTTIPSMAAPDSVLERIRSLATGTDAADLVALPLGHPDKGKNKQNDVVAGSTARDTRPATKVKSVHLKLPRTALSAMVLPATSARPSTSVADPHVLTSEDMDSFMLERMDSGPATGMDWDKFDESLLTFWAQPPAPAQGNGTISSDPSPPPPSPPTVSLLRLGTTRTYGPTRTIRPQSVVPAPSPPRPAARTSSPPLPISSPARPRSIKRKVRFSEDEFVEYLSRYTTKVEDRLRKELLRADRDAPPIREFYTLHCALCPLWPWPVLWCDGYLHATHHLCWDGYLHAGSFLV
jgi:hypothetical protein